MKNLKYLIIITIILTVLISFIFGGLIIARKIKKNKDSDIDSAISDLDKALNGLNDDDFDDFTLDDLGYTMQDTNTSDSNVNDVNESLNDIDSALNSLNADSDFADFTYTDLTN